MQLGKRTSGVSVSFLPLFSSVQLSRSVVSNSATPCIAAGQASLSITNSQSSLRLASIHIIIIAMSIRKSMCFYYWNVFCYNLLLVLLIKFKFIWNNGKYILKKKYDFLLFTHINIEYWWIYIKFNFTYVS